MTEKFYLGISGLIFAVIGVLHLLRIIFGWSAKVGVIVAPLWVSLIVLIIAAFLSFWAFRLYRTVTP
ncbi:hypothetical protein PCC8801_4377 [Rippkaea orientalis PCC 8801]|uniref:Uncharacterized protein n=1 Tax=Rippkaea orientalis (strain PCC 8801 / RF-1) TaxID=41431 RepID=B7JVG6_RIPO1|nr:hypothetical protein [Rippkaea orientalis]ACK68299.1 hypothetical protein PCC8801_4377 [Rippkaea orientalis PCC 8801]